MRIKKLVKYIIGWLKCHCYNIEYKRNCYLGIGLKIVNRGSINLSKNTIIRPFSHLYTGKNATISIGENSEIGNHSTISSHNSVIIEDDVLTGPHVFIADHNHQYENILQPIYRQGIRYDNNSRVIIGKGSWLGTNVVVVGNVRIGKNSVIGANSVVTKDIPDYCVAAGIPCKIIKQYNIKTKEWEKLLTSPQMHS